MIQETDKTIILRDAHQHGDELHLDLKYPMCDKPEGVRKMVIGLEDVRAADCIRISYDFERDGWRIEQASTFSWYAGEEPDPDWQEVAFVRAWAREKPDQPHLG